MKKLELHITIATDNCTAITELTQQCDLSTTVIKQAINKGALWLTRNKKTQRLRRLKKTLKIGEQIHFYYDEKILSQIPIPAKLIADKGDYSIWYKPYGMLSQGTKWSDHCSISRWAQKQLLPERPVFIVHRLDKAATGLIIVAHTKTAVRALTAMFEGRNINQFELEKHYQIIVHGNHSNHCQPEIITVDIDNKKSKSTFSLLSYDETNDLSLIAVKIESGRKHQIRRHAASINLPVVGDRLHGNKNKCYSEELNLQLTAVKLSFICPLTKEKQVFELEENLKPKLKKVIAQLKQ
ncbi:MAG: RNA pseudouridine synthase [Colwellia sp.]|nr:RNA pseudouridine synthase [Colwellia sp.]